LKAKFLTKGKKLPKKSHRVGTSCLDSVKLRLSIVKAVRNYGDKLTGSNNTPMQVIGFLTPKEKRKISLNAK
jgi:hypothetical protein